jgi:hypothetical protein
MNRYSIRQSAPILCALLIASAAHAQRGGPPPPGGGPPPGGAPMLRYHEVVQSDGTVELIPATVAPIESGEADIRIEGDVRIIESNGIPEHLTGAFPNAGNPNEIRSQMYRYTVPAQPLRSGTYTPLNGLFGVCINGVPLDPGAAEFFHGDRASGWQYEALSGAIALGLDESYAHVQPTGAYHYHAAPTLLLSSAGLQPDQHSPLVGWAADGFPIYALYGWDEAGAVQTMRSSYRVKSGDRPVGDNQPGGTYDGTFVNDYEYVEGAGTLDACNGNQVVTPDFPEGTYAYFITEEWPFIPRCFAGTPSADFALGGPQPTLVWPASWGRIKRQ